MLRKFLLRLRRFSLRPGTNRVGKFLSTRRRACFRLLGAGALIPIVLLVHREIYSFIVSRQQFQVPEIRAAVAPPWAGGAGVETIRLEEGGASIYDPGLVDRVGRAFEQSAWVGRVTSVERVFPDQLRVRFEYRKPHVAVRRGAGYVVLDEDRVRLPGVYAVPPPCERGVTVAGVGSVPPEPGRAWEDGALRAGIAMAERTEDLPLLRKLGVRTVDVSNYGGRKDPRRSEVSLVMANGCTLLWGRTEERARFGDVPESEKLENLREVLAAWPDLRGLRRATLYYRGTHAVEPLQAHVRGPR